MSKLTLLIAILAIRSVAASEMIVERVSEVALYPSLLVNPSYISPSHSQQSNLFLFAYSRWNFAFSNLNFEIQPELRAVNADRPLADVNRTSVRSPARLMDLHSKLNSEVKSEAALDVERLFVSSRLLGTQFGAGRRPVSLGVLSVFPVWNKFSKPLVTDYGPLRSFSQDHVSMRLQRGAWLMQAFDIEERDARPSGATRIATVSWFGDGVELHALVGEWWQSGALGLAVVKDIAGTSIRLEEISFSGDGAQIGIGAERAYDEKWSTVLEFLYLEEGAASKNDYLSLGVSRFRPLLARAYSFLRLEYKPAALWIVQAGDLVNLVDSSQLVNIKTIYSAANDVELSTELRLPMGADDSELSRHLLPVQFILGGRVNF